MTLIEYIKQSYQRPNRKILEGLGADEKLINYLIMTSENTNLEVVKALMNSEIQKYIISFDANGGSNPPESIEVIAGEGINEDDIDASGMISPPELSHFNKWVFIDADGNISDVFEYDAETGEYLPFIPTSDTTLIATWDIE